MIQYVRGKLTENLINLVDSCKFSLLFSEVRKLDVLSAFVCGNEFYD